MNIVLKCGNENQSFNLPSHHDHGSDFVNAEQSWWHFLRAFKEKSLQLQDFKHLLTSCHLGKEYTGIRTKVLFDLNRKQNYIYKKTLFLCSVVE